MFCVKVIGCFINEIDYRRRFKSRYAARFVWICSCYLNLKDGIITNIESKPVAGFIWTVIKHPIFLKHPVDTVTVNGFLNGNRQYRCYIFKYLCPSFPALSLSKFSSFFVITGAIKKSRIKKIILFQTCVEIKVSSCSKLIPRMTKLRNPG